MKEGRIETQEQHISNKERIKQLEMTVESLGTNLSNLDIDALEMIREKISAKIHEREQGLSGDKGAVQPATVSEANSEKSEGEKAKIILGSAIDRFVQYVNRNLDFFENGIIEEGERQNIKGVGFLTSQLYASRQQMKPSERAFTGDKRLLTGQLQKEQTVSDVIDKETVIKDAKLYLEDAVIQIELLLNEYDTWKQVWAEKSNDPDFSPYDSFIEMSHRVSGNIEKIRNSL